MDTYRGNDWDLADKIFAMNETEISRFIRTESKTGGLTQTVRRLNEDVLSKDVAKRERAKAAIQRLGFI